MKTGMLGILGLFMAVNVQALTISEPLEFYTNLDVNVADVTCVDGGPQCSVGSKY